MNIIDDLEWRGAINQMIKTAFSMKRKEYVSLYCGIRPNWRQHRIGHLIPFMILRQLAGHKPVILIGGATGSIRGSKWSY